MTIDTYVLFDQDVLKNGNIMTKPEVVAELNHMAVQAALARVAELEHVLRVVVNAADHGSWPTTVMHGIEKVREVLAGSAAPGKEVPQAWLDVQAERRRQIEAEGWTPEHDDAHSHGEMARAAACYALAGSSAPNDGTAALLVSLAWPWDEQWWKPTSVRRDLVKACALALAEIERLDRAASLLSQEVPPCAEH
ncbi:hypothetical protein [Pseudomonas aeruginosa]|uniref:hypothetical protein n=1 Tax=Pseudomonas aeruginosa TaxID=287 RepID=UPI001D189AB7|nr:hypothetical protein [Pseudomonas aeruginosa]UEG07378.1 hypothetical protein LLH04_08170 [Pseudomonas aeruginosa]